MTARKWDCAPKSPNQTKKKTKTKKLSKYFRPHLRKSCTVFISFIYSSSCFHLSNDLWFAQCFRRHWMSHTSQSTVDFCCCASKQQFWATKKKIDSFINRKLRRDRFHNFRWTRDQSVALFLTYCQIFSQIHQIDFDEHENGPFFVRHCDWFNVLFWFWFVGVIGAAQRTRKKCTGRWVGITKCPAHTTAPSSQPTRSPTK